MTKIGMSRAGKRKPLNRVSAKQKKELALRSKLKAELISELPEVNGMKVCPKCGNPPDFRGFQLHHIKHLSQLGKTERNNLIVLCARCHDSCHGARYV